MHIRLILLMFLHNQKGASFILVLVVGLIVGLLIAGVIAFINSRTTSDTRPVTQVETKGVLLSITKPTDGAVLGESEVSISGSTGKNTVIAITGGVDELITETKSGKFSVKIDLREGVNDLVVYAFDTDTGESAQTTLSLVYLKDELGLLHKNVLFAGSHKSVGETNEDRIESLKEKISTQSSSLKKAAATFKRTHVTGTLKSIDGTSLTIEANRGEVKNVFTDDFTKFFSIDSKGKSLIKLENLKIGDKVSIVGVGKDDIDGVAKFVIVIKSTVAKRHAILGKVKEIDGSSITLTHLTQTDREFAVIVSKEAKIKIKGQDENAKVTDIQKDDVIIAVGTVDKNGTISANKLFVVPVKRETPKAATGSATPSSKEE